MKKAMKIVGIVLLVIIVVVTAAFGLYWLITRIGMTNMKRH